MFVPSSKNDTVSATTNVSFGSTEPTKNNLVLSVIVIALDNTIDNLFSAILLIVGLVDNPVLKTSSPVLMLVFIAVSKVTVVELSTALQLLRKQVHNV